MIRAARVGEEGVISDLAIRSKSHWGYSSRELEVFRDELTVTRDDLARMHTYVAETSGVLIGFYTVGALDGVCIELEHLFVAPDSLNLGIGSRLFRHACERARSDGARTLVIQSDPNAAGFYLTLGATLERQIPSIIPGRTLPFFSYPLTGGGAE